MCLFCVVLLLLQRERVAGARTPGRRGERGGGGEREGHREEERGGEETERKREGGGEKGERERGREKREKEKDERERERDHTTRIVQLLVGDLVTISPTIIVHLNHNKKLNKLYK